MIIERFFKNLQGGESVLINIFIRIFNTLPIGITMSFPLCARRQRPFFRCCIGMLFLLLLVTGPLGCQRLLYGEGGLLEGETSVNFAVTVPETPLPVSKPLPVTAEPQTAVVSKPPPPLPPRLLPQDAPVVREPSLAAAMPAAALNSNPQQARVAITRADTILAGRTISEDTVLRGTVLVKGSLVVAPQATLRLEPGTSLRFQRDGAGAQHPRLVVQGRLVCAGTLQKPVVISSAFNEALAADWGGVLLLSTEKKNTLDYCHIEGAETAVEARHSQFGSRGLEVRRSREGVALYDSVATLQATAASRCDVGLIAFDSELDLRETTLRENRQGAVVTRSSLVVAASLFRGNSQEGLLAEQCRFKISGCSAIDNRIGMVLKGGDGQLQQCRFTLNREGGLSAVGTRLKIVHSSFQDNLGVGLKLEGARGSVTQSAFNHNKGGNLQHVGSDSFAAVLNWWGVTDDARIAAGIKEAPTTIGGGRVSFVPFLLTRPSLAP